MQPPLSTRPPDALPAHARKVILSVDDEPGILCTRKQILKAANYEVINAIDGETALEVFDAIPNIDLILLDFAMPGMDGGTVAREMKRRRPSVPICMVTAHEAMVAKMTMVCVDCIIPKGTGPVYLLEKINQMLGSASDVRRSA
jgi:DNA-binding response OmpR family regulator